MRTGIKVPGSALPPKMAGEEELMRPVLSSNHRLSLFRLLSMPNTQDSVWHVAGNPILVNRLAKAFRFTNSVSNFFFFPLSFVLECSKNMQK